MGSDHDPRPGLPADSAAADAWQRCGIGRRVVVHLIAAAPARGITTLTASILAQNAKIADLLRQVPGDFSLAIDGPTLEVRIRLRCL